MLRMRVKLYCRDSLTQDFHPPTPHPSNTDSLYFMWYIFQSYDICCIIDLFISLFTLIVTWFCFQAIHQYDRYHTSHAHLTYTHTYNTYNITIKNPDKCFYTWLTHTLQLKFEMSQCQPEPEYFKLCFKSKMFPFLEQFQLFSETFWCKKTNSKYLI